METIYHSENKYAAKKTIMKEDNCRTITCAVLTTQTNGRGKLYTSLISTLPCVAVFRRVDELTRWSFSSSKKDSTRRSSASGNTLMRSLAIGDRSTSGAFRRARSEHPCWRVGSAGAYENEKPKSISNGFGRREFVDSFTLPAHRTRRDLQSSTRWLPLQPVSHWQ